MVGVVIVTGEEIFEGGGRTALRDKLPGGGGETEVGRGVGGDGAGGEFAEVGDVADLVHHLAELEEIRSAQRAGPGAQGGIEGLPEGGVDVAHRVDAEAVHAPIEPLAENVDEAPHDTRVFVHRIVETDKVAEHGALAREGAVCRGCGRA